MLYEKEREQLCKYVKLMFERKMTNTAGGNITVKMNSEHFIMTPSLMSQKYHCKLTPDQILVITPKGEVVEGNGKITREVNMHFACYESNLNVGCVVHAHALESMFFATMGIDMPNLTEASQKLGEIKCLKYEPAMTVELAEEVRKHVTKNQKLPSAYLLNKHGVLILGDTLEKTFDLLDRLEWNAHIAYKYLLYATTTGQQFNEIDWERHDILE